MWWGPALVLALGTACLEYSPHAVVLDPEERDLHEKALQRLATAPPREGEVFRFAVVGDVQLAFDEAEAVVDVLNARDDLAFVVQLGDFSDLGLLPEFRRMNRLFARLRMPYLVVLGNHDLLGNGEEIYRRMFGPPDLAFTYGRTRFVLFDDNGRERGYRGDIPALAWLAAQVAPDGLHDRAVLLSHVAPGNADFDPALIASYDALLAAAAPAASFHAHEHRPRFEVREGTPLWIADSADGRSYLLATVGPAETIEVERIGF